MLPGSCPGDDDSLVIGSPREFDSLQEVAQDISETSEVIVGRFPGDGRHFGLPVLEEGGDLLDRGHLVLKHVGKLITSD